MARKPGFLASLKTSGASSAVVDQGMTLSSGKIYYTTTAAQNVWDPTVLATFDDNAVPVAAADIDWVDYKMGKVKFADSYTVTGTITMSGNILDKLSVADARSYSINTIKELLDSSVFGDSHVARESARNDVAITFEDLEQGLDDLDGGAGTTQLYSELSNGSFKLFEACPDSASDTTCWRIWVLLESQAQSLDVGDLIGSSWSGRGCLPGYATTSASFGDPEA